MTQASHAAQPHFFALLSKLDDIETAAMRLKMCIRANDLETAREWHTKLKTLTQELYENQYPERWVNHELP